MLKNKFILAGLGLAIASAIIFIYYFSYRKKYKEVIFDKDYSVIVKKVFSMRGYTYLNDSLQVRPLTLKTDSGEIWLREFVQKEDLFLKKKNSDSVEIKRGDSSFIFSPFVDEPKTKTK